MTRLCLAAGGYRSFDKVIVYGPRNECFEASTHEHIGLQSAPYRLHCKSHRMLKPAHDNVIDIGPENQNLIAPLPPDFHFNSQKRGVLDFDIHFFNRRYQIMAAIVIAAQHPGKQLDQRHAANGTALVEPSPIAGNFQPDITAINWIPEVYGRWPARSRVFEECFKRTKLWRHFRCHA